MTPTPDPARRIRQNPQYPDVWEYPVEHIRELYWMTKGTPCRGCPHHGVDSPTGNVCLLKGTEVSTEKNCRQDTVWYGEHIHMANILEGKL